MAKGFAGLAFVLMLLVSGIVFGVYSKGLLGGSERVVRLDGTFTLIDQSTLYSKVMQLSAQYPDRKQFADAIQNVLSRQDNISHVSVRYTWPEVAIVQVEEIMPIAIVNEHFWLTRHCDQVIRNSLVGEDDLVSIQMEKPVSNSSDCETLKGLLKMITRLAGIEEVIIRSNGEYAIHYRGVEFIMNGENIEKTLRRITALYAALDMKKQNIKYVDMRHIGGVSVALSGTSS